MGGSYLCYCELHVEDRTFYLHYVVKALTEGAAIEKLVRYVESQKKGESYTLQAKGCLGAVSGDLLDKYMALPKVSADKQ